MNYEEIFEQLKRDYESKKAAAAETRALISKLEREIEDLRAVVAAIGRYLEKEDEFQHKS